MTYNANDTVAAMAAEIAIMARITESDGEHITDLRDQCELLQGKVDILTESLTEARAYIDSIMR